MKKTIRHRLWRLMYDRGWTRSELDDTLRSRVAHAVYDYKHWWDWGHPVMWLVGRNDTGTAGAPRGRDMWWIPIEYVEGIAASLVADLDQRYGCYITTEYSDVRNTRFDIEWRIYDHQDDGRTTKVALYPNAPEHQGRLQPLPWQELKVDLFLWWWVWEHKAKAQWFGLRSWLYTKALHNAVHGHGPFTCASLPPRGTGGYSHWHCQRRPLHRGEHRFNNYVWARVDAERVQYDPQEVSA